jgi:hypothetical protein
MKLAYLGSARALSEDGRFFFASHQGLRGPLWDAWRLQRPQASFVGVFASLEASVTACEREEQAREPEFSEYPREQICLNASFWSRQGDLWREKTRGSNAQRR